MSFNICSISGIPAEHPVVSKKTGHVFEKRFIEKHIELKGTCPITNLELSKADLIEVKVVQKYHKPRSVNSTSIPGMFTELQSEWEKILIETYQLKKQMEISKQELAHSMYQYDASCRVICKLLKERDLAREELENYQMELDEGELALIGEEFELMGITKNIISKIEELSYKLITERKQRKVPEHLPKLEQISQYKCNNTIYPFIDTQKTSNNIVTNNPVGISCLDVNPFNYNYIIVGSNDGRVAFCDTKSENEIPINKFHKRTVNDIQFYPSESIIGYLACSDDSTATFCVKNEKNTFIEKYKINQHSQSITGGVFHPLQEYGIVSSLDGYWSFHNFIKGIILHKELNGQEITTLKFQPDGGIFSTGDKNGIIKLWDISSQQEFSKLQESGMVNLNSLSFSENGFYLASCGFEDNTVRVWDIRKNKVIKYLNLSENKFVSQVDFDYTGSYLCVSGNFLGVCDIKSMELITSFENHKDQCTGFKFDRNNMDKTIISTSLGGELKIHSLI